MIEIEFKDMINSIELGATDRKDKQNVAKNIIDSIASNCNKNFKIVCLKNTTELIKKDNLYEVIISFQMKNKTLPYELLQVSFMNEIENCIYLNIKNNIIYKDELPLVIRDYRNNVFTITLKHLDLSFKFYIYYNKESLTKITSDFDEKVFLYSQYEIEEKYFQYIKKEYQRFDNVLKLTRSFIYDIGYKSNEINVLALKYLLSYSLIKYPDENSYIGYFHSLVKGLGDLIDGVIITPKEEVYNEYKVFGAFTTKGRFKIISIASKLCNLLVDFDNNPNSIKLYKELRSKIVSLLPKEGKFVTIDCNPNYVVKGKTIEWCFQIESTDISNNGGEYEYNEDNYFMCIYKAMLKGLQFIVKNKLGNNVIIKCATLKPFQTDNLSYENESRFANIISFIKDNDLGIEYKLSE